MIFLRLKKYQNIYDIYTDLVLNFLKKNKIEVIEFPFPEKLEKTTYGYDYVFIRDGFISDLNGKALILNFSQKLRQKKEK